MSKKREDTRNHPRPKPETKTWFDAIERYARDHANTMLWIVLIAGLVFALLLFDVKPSIGGDDTSYILQAHSFITSGTSPVGFKSPGYPIVLALFMIVTGLNVVMLKFTSLLFYLASLGSCFVVFRKRLEPMVFYSLMLLLTLSSLVLEYSHQTYSEMTYLLIQLWTIHFFLKAEDNPSGASGRQLFVVALLAMVGFYIRAIGATLPLAIGLWYLSHKQWKRFAVLSAFCLLLYLPWKIAEFHQGIVMMGQASGILLINPYNPALGRETLGGFGIRFVDNLFLHLNYMFPKALSLPFGEDLAAAEGTLLPNAMAFLGVLFSTILIVGVYRSIRYGTTELRFLALYLVVYLVSIWLALQTLYATPRMLVPMMPILILMFVLGVYGVLHKSLGTGQNRTPAFKGWYVFLAAWILISNVATLAEGIETNLPVLKANLGGDQFAGFSPDWVNYLKACQWISKNLPKDSTGVICRKPELFQIYSGGFYAYGTYTIESSNPDTIVAHWKSWRLTHLLYDNFQWSTTLRRYVQPVAEKYPKIFEPVHQEGTEYPSYVYRLNYSAIDGALTTAGTAK